MFRVIISALLLTGLLLSFAAVADDDELLNKNESAIPVGRPELILRSGYMANVWVPAGLEPYELDDYGRNLFYVELALNHPLFHLGEMFDIINVPSLRLETNFGYTSESEGYYEVIPDVVRIVPYVRASTWVTMLESFSVRYRVERFDATLINPTPGSDSTLYVTNEMRDIEIGYLSETSNHDLTYEIGYYYSEINWPEVYRISQWFVETPRVKDWGISMHGAYGALHFTGWPTKYGLHTQAVLRVGQVMGLDLRLNIEHPISKDWSIGVQADGSYRYIAGYNHQYADYIHTNDSNPYDTRFRINLYTVFVLI
ncbi:hypothetical protein KQI52_14590 [bacterium]|nr:hypothetical protein [bacterium]